MYAPGGESPLVERERERERKQLFLFATVPYTNPSQRPGAVDAGTPFLSINLAQEKQCAWKKTKRATAKCTEPSIRNTTKSR